MQQLNHLSVGSSLAQRLPRYTRRRLQRLNWQQRSAAMHIQGDILLPRRRILYRSLDDHGIGVELERLEMVVDPRVIEVLDAVDDWAACYCDGVGVNEWVGG